MAARLTTYLVVAIVAATLIAGLIVGAQRDDTDGPVDLIVHNAKVFTADADGTMAEAVAIRGNQILRVGSNREINRLRRPQTIVLDAEGGAVLPGFNDAHVHLLSGGLGLDRLALADAETADDVQRLVAEWAIANPDRPWVLGRGWRPAMFNGNLPTRQQLDAVVPDRPALLVSADGHAAWLNTRALRLARIDRRTKDPASGAIVRDARTGDPSGVLRDGAVALAESVVPRVSRDERARALRAAIAEAHRHGVTSVHDTDADADDLAQYDEVRRSGDLDLRIFAAVRFSGAATDARLAQLDELRMKYPDDPLFKTGAVTLTVDGAIESHTAAMLDPFASRPLEAEPLVAPDDLNRVARQLDARGWQLMSLATGDRAVRMTLDAYAHAVRSNPEPARSRRHRIEHADIIDEADLARVHALGVVMSLQPFDGSPDAPRIAAWIDALGPERAALLWPLASLAKRGARLAFGSNWPSAPLDPMLEIHAAVNRTSADGSPDGAWQVSERLDLKAAIRAFTSTPAYASFDEHRKGTLSQGMLADLVVLSADIFSAPPSTLAASRVAVTIFDGKIVYRKNAKPLTH